MAAPITPRKETDLDQERGHERWRPLNHTFL